MRSYEVAEEIRIDILAREIYGSEQRGTVEALLDANPGLACSGSGYVPPGTIDVPNTPQPVPLATVNPWE